MISALIMEFLRQFNPRRTHSPDDGDLPVQPISCAHRASNSLRSLCSGKITSEYLIKSGFNLLVCLNNMHVNAADSVRTSLNL